MSIIRGEIVFNKSYRGQKIGLILIMLIIGIAFSAVGPFVFYSGFTIDDDPVIVLLIFGPIFFLSGIMILVSSVKIGLQKEWTEFRIGPEFIEIKYTRPEQTERIPLTALTSFSIDFGSSSSRNRSSSNKGALIQISGPPTIDFQFNTATSKYSIMNAPRPRDLAKTSQLFQAIKTHIQAQNSILITSNVDDMVDIIAERGVDSFQQMDVSDQLQSIRHVNESTEMLADFADRHPNYFKYLPLIKIVAGIVVVGITIGIVYLNITLRP
ncbi:MAG: hypothetical protein ACTSVZ_05535 [Promethearchaeota archaeon]